MFVNIFNTSMFLSRGVFRGGAKGAHPPSGSVKYMLFFWGGGEAKTPSKRIYFTSPKNEDLRNIFLGLRFCILTDLKVVEN